MHGLSPDGELNYWRSQARHWQRETERVKQVAVDAIQLVRSVAHEYADDNPAWADRHLPRRIAETDTLIDRLLARGREG